MAEGVVIAGKDAIGSGVGQGIVEGKSCWRVRKDAR